MAGPGPVAFWEAPSDAAGALVPGGEGQLEVRDLESSLEPKLGATSTPEGSSLETADVQGPIANPRVSLRPDQPPYLKM